MALRVRNRGVNKHSSMPPFLGGATLDMNFAAGLYFGATPADLTATRSGSTAFAQGSGALSSFAINTPRISDLGLHIDEARTNICLQSQTFATTWTTAAASVLSDQTAAPDGTATADLVTEDGTNAAHGVNQTITIASNVAYAGSVYVKPGGRTWFRLFLDDGAGTNLVDCYFNASGAGTVGTATNGGTGANAAGAITALGNGWYRLVLTGTPASASTGSVRFLIRMTTADLTTGYAGNSTSGAYVWGAQVEACTTLPIATAYTPTTTGSQARGGDIVTLASTAFSSWFNSAITGTFYVEAVRPSSAASAGSANPCVMSANDGTVNNRMLINQGTAPSYSWTVNNGGVAQCAVGVNAAVPGTSRFAGAFAANSFQHCINGTLGTQDTSGTIPSGLTTLNIGTDRTGINFYSGIIRRIAFFPARLTDAQLQTITG